MTLYDMAMDTILLCFCEDVEMNDGEDHPYFMSDDLREFVSENEEKNAKNSGEQLTPIKQNAQSSASGTAPAYVPPSAGTGAAPSSGSSSGSSTQNNPYAAKSAGGGNGNSKPSGGASSGKVNPYAK